MYSLASWKSSKKGRREKRPYGRSLPPECHPLASRKPPAPGVSHKRKHSYPIPLTFIQALSTCMLSVYDTPSPVLDTLLPETENPILVPMWQTHPRASLKDSAAKHTLQENERDEGVSGGMS